MAFWSKKDRVPFTPAAIRAQSEEKFLRQYGASGKASLEKLKHALEGCAFEQILQDMEGTHAELTGHVQELRALPARISFSLSHLSEYAIKGDRHLQDRVRARQFNMWLTDTLDPLGQ